MNVGALISQVVMLPTVEVLCDIVLAVINSVINKVIEWVFVVINIGMEQEMGDLKLQVIKRAHLLV